jgi:hypothetical protein
LGYYFLGGSTFFSACFGSSFLGSAFLSGCLGSYFLGDYFLGSYFLVSSFFGSYFLAGGAGGALGGMEQFYKIIISIFENGLYINV